MSVRICARAATWHTHTHTRLAIKNRLSHNPLEKRIYRQKIVWVWVCRWVGETSSQNPQCRWERKLLFPPPSQSDLSMWSQTLRVIRGRSTGKGEKWSCLPLPHRSVIRAEEIVKSDLLIGLATFCVVGKKLLLNCLFVCEKKWLCQKEIQKIIYAQLKLKERRKKLRLIRE